MADPSKFDPMIRIKEALGLAGRPIERIVIVYELDEPVQVFIKERLDPGSMEQAAEALQEFRDSLTVESVAEVVVDDNANVFVAEKEKADD